MYYLSQTQMDPPSTPEVKLMHAYQHTFPPCCQMVYQMYQIQKILNPKSLTAHRLQAPLQMQKTDPFCKRISKRLSNGKAPQHETDLFTHVRGLLYKHITFSGQKFLALVMPKSWQYTVLVEAHDKLGHQGNTHTYCLIKHQYYWKGINKDIRKYIENCTLCYREKSQSPGLPTSDDGDSRQSI